MADRRVSDLSYGHLGDASYDIDERQWEFSVDTCHSQIFEQIAPFKESLPSIVPDIPKTVRAHNFAQSQMKWIIKTRPELFPANVIASSFTKTSASRKDDIPSFGQLLAIGGAVEADRPTEQRTQPIIAIPSGEAGHVLRLVRAQTEYRGWRKQSAVKLPLLHASRDIGYWVGTGGTIHQITFSNERNGPGTLLAIRQDSVVTIFRPMYHKQRARAVVPKGYDNQYPSSRLCANPIATLTAEQCGSRRHADISFNPFYSRQFGVVDDSGHWSIWDIEGRMRRNTTLELVPGRSGGIYDDSVHSPHGKDFQKTDSWHRILWGSNRSPTNFRHMFVLTTSRIFWINVLPAAGERGEKDAGLRVILSYRHFRDISDETMRLTVLPEDVYVLISSAKSPLVNFYVFSTDLDHIGPTSSQGSFSFVTGEDFQHSDHEIISLSRTLFKSSDAMADSLVVADDNVSEEEIDYAATNLSQNHSQFSEIGKRQDFLRPSLDWQSMFQRMYMDTFSYDTLDSSLKSFESMSELVDNISHFIGQRSENDTLPITSLFEISHLADFSGDLQQSSLVLSSFLENLQTHQDFHKSFELVLSDLNSCPGTGLTVAGAPKFSDLLRVYDQVGEHWMASLPLKVSNLARLSKFKVARRVAVELCLSSIAVSIHKISSAAKVTTQSGGDLALHGEEPEESPSLMTPNVAINVPLGVAFSLPASSRAPSVYSHTSNEGSEFAENTSIARLRQYAVSIKPRSDLHESPLLAQWHSTPGVDPALYSWRSMVDEVEDELDLHKRREKEHRRRRTERFLQREQRKESQGSSQPTVMRPSSQPEIGQPATSSQSVADIPMTQPDRGSFGARSAKPGKKRKGKRRAAGF
ncbi:hypothetical protein OIDMADRAFT_188861 [Oidiodendron maius Zn]|uniref:RNA polymerase I-specific transcription initiation factor RRN6-like protein n=1 Tax=Oidiodendron maius (strain Zn) TaxID=913774 RepID=A0A0C3HR93_OIDMZ|nr:hypothetical protein OIDMADRAFT_188861 [Oidiodendron maius Zn]